jgi:hypothetical protein
MIDKLITYVVWWYKTLYQVVILVHTTGSTWYQVLYHHTNVCNGYLSENWTFSLCVLLIKSGSLNWPWCTKILCQFVTHMYKFSCQSDVKHYDIIDKNNNVSSEGLDRHYHKYPSLSFRTRWDISNNDCLNLQNCCYSICITDLIWSCDIDMIMWHVCIVQNEDLANDCSEENSMSSFNANMSQSGEEIFVQAFISQTGK